MSDDAPAVGSQTRDLLAKMSRYEALFELMDLVNAADDIESVGGLLARRLKYIVDAYAWRYVCLDWDPPDAGDMGAAGIVVDGARGRAVVTRAKPLVLSSLEAELWRDHRTRMLDGEDMRTALGQLPDDFQRDDIEQISAIALVDHGRTEAIYVFCKRRLPFTELDVKCLAMVCSFFHRKVHMLWERQKHRDLELAYLKQEAMLRESEKLATLGRLSAGMAHELNNPAAAARRGADQLKASLAHLEAAHQALGGAGLSPAQLERIASLEEAAGKRARSSTPLDLLNQGDLERELEEWLDQAGVPEAWEHAAALGEMGLRPSELEDLAATLDPSAMPIVIDYLSTRFVAHGLTEDIGQGARRVTEIVDALKGYVFLDQAPVQWLDVQEGLEDTLVLLRSRIGNGVEIDTDFARELPRISGHGSELNQVWTHLIDNALDAMGEAGRLELRTYGEEGWVVLEVADSGPGIPVEDQQTIFDPFYTTKPPGEGAGLGLSISHSIIVEKHGGTISVDSRPGATRFTVRLPIDAQPLPESETSPEALESSEPENVKNHEA